MPPVNHSLLVDPRSEKGIRRLFLDEWVMQRPSLVNLEILPHIILTENFVNKVLHTA